MYSNARHPGGYHCTRAKAQEEEKKKDKCTSKSRSKSRNRRRKKRRPDTSESSRQRSGDHHPGEVHGEAKAEDYPEQTSRMNESFDAEDDATLADNLQRFIEHLYYGFWMWKKAAQLLFTELSLCLLEKLKYPRNFSASNPLTYCTWEPSELHLRLNSRVLLETALLIFLIRNVTNLEDVT